MAKIVKYIASFVVVLTIACVYSWMVYHVSTGGNKLGQFGKGLKKFARFPQFVEEVLNSPEVQNIPKTFIAIDTSFQPINKLDYDLYGVSSFWDNKKDKWEIRLINFKDETILYKWYFERKDYPNYHYQYHNSPPKQILVLPDSQIVGRLTMSPNLFRLDANSDFIWHNQELEYHHSINFTLDGNIWAAGNDLFEKGSEIYTGGLVKNLSGELVSFWENYIVKVDIETGEILYKKGVGRLLLENGYKSILLGGDVFDPTHLNDIQPCLTDSKYWKKGDLFLSLRNRSLLILYRPSTNEIIRLIQGPFINQHDIDILSDSTISIFNNNHFSNRGFNTNDAYMEADSLNSSEILIYDFAKDSFSVFQQALFVEEGIQTLHQGLSEFISNGDLFVEAQNNGIYYIIRDDEILYRNVFYSPDSNFIQLPTWTRLYEENPLKELN